MAAIAVYGGSFDPPHVAHVLVVAYALAVGGFERLVVVPVFQHAFAKRLASFEHRVKMCELAFAPFTEVSVSRIEERLPVPNLTLNMLTALKAELADSELRLVIGSDVLGDLEHWHAFDEIRRIASPFIVERAGHALEDGAASLCALPAISSTQVRTLLEQRADPASRAALERLVPSRVLDYVEEHGLYSGA